MADALGKIYAIDPAALVFGTDLPSTRAPPPFRSSDIDLVERVLGPESRCVLWQNAQDFYTMTVR